jgi:hypothetical protein
MRLPDRRGSVAIGLKLSDPGDDIGMRYRGKQHLLSSREYLPLHQLRIPRSRVGLQLHLSRHPSLGPRTQRDPRQRRIYPFTAMLGALDGCQRSLGIKPTAKVPRTFTTGRVPHTGSPSAGSSSACAVKHARGRPWTQTPRPPAWTGRHTRPLSRRPWTCPNDGAVTVANTSGLSATVSGTVLPPATPVRIRWNMSPACTREHDGHSLARRFPHRTWVTPSGSDVLL